MRAGRVGAEPLDLVLLVGLEVALEPEPLRVALVGQDVRGDPVQEPPVVGDDHRAAGELEQRVLQRGQRLDVEVVGRLVEQQQVAALLEGQREVEPVALAAGEHAGRLLLVRALEAERGDVGARRHLDLADLDVVEPVGDDLPQRLLRVDAGRGSGRRRRCLTVSPTLMVPLSGSSSPMSILNSVVLPAPLGPMTPTMPLRGSVNDRSSMSTRSPKPLVRCVDLDDRRCPAAGPAGSGSPRSRACGSSRPRRPSPRSARGGPCSWPAGPWRWSAPTRARP